MCQFTCLGSCALCGRCSGSWWSRCHWCRASCRSVSPHRRSSFRLDFVVQLCTCSQAHSVNSICNQILAHFDIAENSSFEVLSSLKWEHSAVGDAHGQSSDVCCCIPLVKDAQALAARGQSGAGSAEPSVGGMMLGCGSVCAQFCRSHQIKEKM